MQRRTFLKAIVGCTALVAVPALVRAQALPVSNEVSGLSNYTRSTWTNYVKRVGPSLSAAQRATIAAAANDNLAATAARVGARSGVALLAPFVGASAAPIVAGVVIIGAIAAAGYLAYKYWGTDRTGAGGKSSTTTYEQALASSNWSMRNKPNWSLWKQQNVAGGWQADWLWTPPAGKTQADFNHQTDVAPYQTTKVTVPEIHAALDTADQTLPVSDDWLAEALQGLAVDTATQAAAAGTPLPAPFADPATIPAIVPADFPVGVPRPGPGAVTQPVPGVDGSSATAPDLATDPSPGTNPDPDPDPDPGTDPGTDPEPGTGEGIDPGEEVDPEGVADLPGYEEFASPFRNLFDPFKAAFEVGDHSCPTITFPSMQFGQMGSTSSFVIDQHCTLIEPLKPAIAAAAAACGGISAISHIVDA